jgi:hypothetical protein
VARPESTRPCRRSAQSRKSAEKSSVKSTALTRALHFKVPL